MVLLTYYSHPWFTPLFGVIVRMNCNKRLWSLDVLDSLSGVLRREMTCMMPKTAQHDPTLKYGADFDGFLCCPGKRETHR